MPRSNVVVIGTSAGGIPAMKELFGRLPANLEACLFVAMHVPAYRESHLPEILSRAGPLPAVHPHDGQRLENGTIYVAPPDFHMLIHDGVIRLGRGPRENHTRPSVDPLFRSAALSHGPRVIGIVLTGLLGDGAAGMLAIKRRGGTTAIQDPTDAAYPDMPENVLRAIDVDFRGTALELADFIVRSTKREVVMGVEIPMDEQLHMENEVAEGKDVGREAVAQDPPSVFGCPDCGGVLWQVNEGNLERFRCRTGHAYSEEALYIAQAENVESALWTALRALSESAELALRLAKRARTNGDAETGDRFQRRRDELLRSIDVIRASLSQRPAPAPPDEALVAAPPLKASR